MNQVYRKADPLSHHALPEQCVQFHDYNMRCIFLGVLTQINPHLDKPAEHEGVSAGTRYTSGCVKGVFHLCALNIFMLNPQTCSTRSSHGTLTTFANRMYICIHMVAQQRKSLTKKCQCTSQRDNNGSVLGSSNCTESHASDNQL